jgi:hypothetical protein
MTLPLLICSSLPGDTSSLGGLSNRVHPLRLTIAHSQQKLLEKLRDKLWISLAPSQLEEQRRLPSRLV